MKNNEIKIQGARVHNLKNVSVNIGADSPDLTGRFLISSNT